jgi:hypothetical protein
MSPEGQESEEHEADARPARGDAHTDEPITDEITGSPFTAPELEEQLRSFMTSRVVLASFSPVEEEDEPATPPSEPRPEESPFTTPEIEEVERAPGEGDSEHRDA